MKKINKRVLALFMALVLMFSCTAFASASVPESVVPELGFETVSENGDIMPLAFQQLINPMGGQKPIYGTGFKLTSPAYVTIIIVTDCRSQMHAEVNGADSAALAFTVNNSEQKYFSFKKWLPSGDYYFTLTVPNSAQTTFALAATDYVYPRNSWVLRVFSITIKFNT